MYKRQELLGGFRGDEVSAAQRDPDAYPTILSADVDRNDGPALSSRADNAYGLIEIPQGEGMGEIEIDGFALKGTYEGMTVRSEAYFTLRRCSVSECVNLMPASFFSGGIESFGGARIESCELIGNVGFDIRLFGAPPSNRSQLLNSSLSANTSFGNLVELGIGGEVISSVIAFNRVGNDSKTCLLYTSPSPRD